MVNLLQKKILIAMAIVVGVDCSGECGGDAVVDECGECGGTGASFECLGWQYSMWSLSECSDDLHLMHFVSFGDVDLVLC